MKNQTSILNLLAALALMAMTIQAISGPTMLAPEAIRQFMFTQEIDGTLPTLKPDNQQLNNLGKVIR